MAVPKEKLAALEPYLGKKITFGIRPEHIHDPKYMFPGTVASVKAMVEVTELMGNEFFLHLIADGKPFLAHVDPRTSARPGQNIEVVFGMDEMHAFDPKTGQAISANKGESAT